MDRLDALRAELFDSEVQFKYKQTKLYEQIVTEAPYVFTLAIAVLFVYEFQQGVLLYAIDSSTVSAIYSTLVLGYLAKLVLTGFNDLESILKQHSHRTYIYIRAIFAVALIVSGPFLICVTYQYKPIGQPTIEGIFGGILLTVSGILTLYGLLD